MISYLRGNIIAKQDRYIILVQGDSIGYRVYVTTVLFEIAALNQEMTLYVYTNVREDAIDLFGFPTIDELSFFEMLIGITGIGPRTALGVLSVAPLADVKKAIIHGDAAILQKVSSIGKKTAERIIIELKEKISVTEKEVVAGLSITENVQLFEALASLGYKEAEIRRAVTQLSTESKKLPDRIREALKILGKS